MAPHVQDDFGAGVGQRLQGGRVAAAVVVRQAAWQHEPRCSDLASSRPLALPPTTADIQEEGVAELADLSQQPEVQEKLRRRIAQANIKALAPPRPGKKLLVADIDYTIFDLNSPAERPEELVRG